MVAEAPTYRQDLDLVVVSPEDEMAACMNLWYDEKNRCGLVEPLGTRAEHRRKGLGSAMYQEGMRRLRVLGAASVIVATSGTNPQAKALAESVGFREVARLYEWRKPL